MSKKRPPSEHHRYNDRMDPECIALCDALNNLPGIETCASCCGHGHDPFRVWFFAAAIPDLVPISRVLDHQWRVLLTHVDLPYRIAFKLEGPPVLSAGDELAEDVYFDETSDSVCNHYWERHDIRCQLPPNHFDQDHYYLVPGYAVRTDVKFDPVFSAKGSASRTRG